MFTWYFYQMVARKAMRTQKYKKFRLLYLSNLEDVGQIIGIWRHLKVTDTFVLTLFWLFEHWSYWLDKINLKALNLQEEEINLCGSAVSVYCSALLLPALILINSLFHWHAH